MDELIRENEDLRRAITDWCLTERPELFLCLREKGLLDWNMVDINDIYIIGNLNSLKWMEENGVNVLNNKKAFRCFVSRSPAAVMEYLMVERGMTVEFMCLDKYNDVDFALLQVIKRVKGEEAIRNIEMKHIWIGFHEVKLLKSVGYDFKEKIRSQTEIPGYDIYCLLCFHMLKYEDLTDESRASFKEYVEGNDIKATRKMVPFMKEVRKRKITTFLCCLKKIPLSYALPKEIVWNIIDYAYSPVNERGFF